MGPLKGPWATLHVGRFEKLGAIRIQHIILQRESVVFYTERMRERKKFKLGRLEIVHSLLEAGLKYRFVIFCGWKSDRV